MCAHNIQFQRKYHYLLAEDFTSVTIQYAASEVSDETVWSFQTLQLIYFYISLCN